MKADEKVWTQVARFSSLLFPADFLILYSSPFQLPFSLLPTTSVGKIFKYLLTMVNSVMERIMRKKRIYFTLSLYVRIYYLNYPMLLLQIKTFKEKITNSSIYKFV